MKTVVGMYDQFEDARRAIEGLHDAGFEKDDISLIMRDREGKFSKELDQDQMRDTGQQDVKEGATKGAGIGAALGGLGGLLVGLGALAIPGIGPVVAAGPIVSALAGAGVGAVAGGVVGALVDLGIPEEHAEYYAEGVRRGGSLVLVRTEDMMADQAADILNRYHPVDVQERVNNWRTQENWQGFDYSMEEPDLSTSEYDRSTMQSSNIPVTGSMTDRDTGDYDQDLGESINRQMDEARHDLEHERDENIPVTGRETDTTIPIIEEEMRIGKREVDRGGVHVEKYEEEMPVEEDINLRKEQINVERRPVDREATPEDFAAFKEGSMDLKETEEEPVVDKRSRVVEEVHIDKDVTEKSEKIRDTLHRTDVDISRTGQDWDQFNTRFRQDFQTRFGTSGMDYDHYQSAYRYGYDLGTNPRYQTYEDWNSLESEARVDWQRRGEKSTWDEVKDAVRHAWESVRRG